MSSIAQNNKKKWVPSNGQEMKGRRPPTLKEQQLGSQIPWGGKCVVSPAQKHRDDSDVR